MTKQSFQERIDRALAIIEAGGSIMEAVKGTPLNWKTLKSEMKKRGISAPEKKQRGMSKEDEQRIRSLAAEGLTRREIADNMGLKLSTVKGWIYRQSLACKPEPAGKRVCASDAAGQPDTQGRKLTVRACAQRAFLKDKRVSGESRAQRCAAHHEVAQLPVIVGLYGMSDADRAALAATGGRYRDLEAFAMPRGLTVKQAQQRWHALGLSFSKGSV